MDELLKNSDSLYHLAYTLTIVAGGIGFLARWLRQHLVSSLSTAFASKDQVERIEKKVDSLHAMMADAQVIELEEPRPTARGRAYRN